MHKFLLGVVAVSGLLIIGGGVSATTGGSEPVVETEPQLITFTITPQYVDTTNGDQDVKVKFKASDDVGICYGSDVTACGSSGSYPAQLTLSNGDHTKDLNYNNFALVYGSAQHGYFAQTLSLPQGSPIDEWEVTSFMICDTDEPIGNCRSFTEDDLEAQFGDDVAEVENTPYKVFRFWSDVFQGHFYTNSVEERDHIIKNLKNWKYERAAYDAAEAGDPGAVAVHRFWSDTYGHHFYTMSEEERDHVIANYGDIWRYEGIAYYVYDPSASDSKPVHRFWSDEKMGHFYTSSEDEKQITMDTYPEHVWKYEGVAWHVKD